MKFVQDYSEVKVMSKYPRISKNKELVINQLKVLTGIEDINFLNKTYDQTEGDINKALNYIENYKSPPVETDVEMPDHTGIARNKSIGPAMFASTQTSMDVDDQQTSVTSLKNPVTIDLTNEDADLQRAIKLSMECSTTMSSTNGDPNSLQRVRNNSFSGVSMATTPLHPADPNLRRRKAPDWPAGLKNVGNTCWFSAVIQSLFNLPIFRNLILQYKPPSQLPPEDTEAYQNICFMQELRKLFALLVGSNQSYVDPTICVKQLQGFFKEKNAECQQQDVSEFTHKLLDWLEDAFKHQSEQPQDAASGESLMEVDTNEEASSREPPNPMVNLFYGEYKAHGVNNGNSFTRPHKFGLYPLYVHEANDLHESIEYTTRDCTLQDAKEGVGQEVWFTSLPPVLIFELSRFHYNQKSAVPEKIHSQLDFPSVLYMDRYMEDNSERIRRCRDDCQKLRESLRELKTELRRRRKMTIGEKSYPIQDILQCCSEFAHSRRKRFLEKELNSTDQEEITDETRPSKKIRGGNDGSSPEYASEVQGGGDAPERLGQASQNEKEIANAAAVEQCLKTWMVELDHEKEGLRDDINDIQGRLDSMYDDPSLKNHPYTLHAVLVHQGHAVAGHYWAYVRDHCKSRWLKFNDTSVTVSNWDELVQDSVGGGSSIASAYCLMYIDRNQKNLLMGTPNGEKVLSSNNELQTVIEKHNSDFVNEVEEWDIKQATMLSLSTQTNLMEGGDKSIPSTQSEDSGKKQDSRSGTPSKLRRERKDSLTWNASACKDAINGASNIHEVLGPEEALEHVVTEEWNRLKDLAREATDGTSDPRLHHIAVYMFKNLAPRKMTERAVLEQFADSRLSYDKVSTEIMKCAKEKLTALTPNDLNNEEFVKWQRDYRAFCRATCYLIRGLELFHSCKYADALPYLANVKVENDKVAGDADGALNENKLADWTLASKTIAKCLKKLHFEALTKFRREDSAEAEGGLSTVEECIVPWIHLLDNEDALLQKIRNDWCTEESRDGLQAKLESALQALLDPPTLPETQAAFRTPVLIRPQNPQDLCERFHKAMSTMLTTECR